jgi:hypothetical protein
MERDVKIMPAWFRAESAISTSYTAHLPLAEQQNAVLWFFGGAPDPLGTFFRVAASLGDDCDAGTAVGITQETAVRAFRTLRDHPDAAKKTQQGLIAPALIDGRLYDPTSGCIVKYRLSYFAVLLPSPPMACRKRGAPDGALRTRLAPSMRSLDELGSPRSDTDSDWISDDDDDTGSEHSTDAALVHAAVDLVRPEQPRMTWSMLPADIMRLVAQMAGLPGWIALTQVNRETRRVLDDVGSFRPWLATFPADPAVWMPLWCWLARRGIVELFRVMTEWAHDKLRRAETTDEITRMRKTEAPVLRCALLNNACLDVWHGLEAPKGRLDYVMILRGTARFLAQVPVQTLFRHIDACVPQHVARNSGAAGLFVGDNADRGVFFDGWMVSGWITVLMELAPPSVVGAFVQRYCMLPKNEAAVVHAIASALTSRSPSDVERFASHPALLHFLCIDEWRSLGILANRCATMRTRAMLALPAVFAVTPNGPGGATIINAGNCEITRMLLATGVIRLDLYGEAAIEAAQRRSNFDQARMLRLACGK